MRIGVVSDTHDRSEAVAEAVRLLGEQKVDLILHCGDIESPETVALFKPIPTHFVFGNWDKDKAKLTAAIKRHRRHVPRLVRGASNSPASGSPGSTATSGTSSTNSNTATTSTTSSTATRTSASSTAPAGRWWPTPVPCSGRTRRRASCWTWSRGEFKPIIVPVAPKSAESVYGMAGLDSMHGLPGLPPHPPK